MTPATTIIPLGPRGAAFLGVAGLAVPIPTGLRATTDHHQVIILRADIGGIALALAVVTSAQAMSPGGYHHASPRRLRSL